MRMRLLRSVLLVVRDAQFRTAAMDTRPIRNDGSDTTHMRFCITFKQVSVMGITMTNFVTIQSPHQQGRPVTGGIIILCVSEVPPYST